MPAPPPWRCPPTRTGHDRPAPGRPADDVRRGHGASSRRSPRPRPPSRRRRRARNATSGWPARPRRWPSGCATRRRSKRSWPRSWRRTRGRVRPRASTDPARAPPLRLLEHRVRSGDAGVAQLAERQPSKLHVAGSIPVSRSNPPRSLALRLRRDGEMIRGDRRDEERARVNGWPNIDRARMIRRTFVLGVVTLAVAILYVALALAGAGGSDGRLDWLPVVFLAASGSWSCSARGSCGGIKRRKRPRPGRRSGAGLRVRRTRNGPAGWRPGGAARMREG